MSFIQPGTCPHTVLPITTPGRTKSPVRCGNVLAALSPRFDNGESGMHWSRANRDFRRWHTPAGATAKTRPSAVGAACHDGPTTGCRATLCRRMSGLKFPRERQTGQNVSVGVTVARMARSTTSVALLPAVVPSSYVVDVEFTDSARKHGHSDEDILYAWRNPIRIFDEDDMRMIVGPDRAGNLLEVGASTCGSEPRIVHVMVARKKWLR